MVVVDLFAGIHDIDDPAGGWVSPEWGWAWPANRRLLYNRASADRQGRPWSERKRYVWWDQERGKWVGEDMPDFKETKAPDYVPPSGARAEGAVSFGPVPQGLDDDLGGPELVLLQDELLEGLRLGGAVAVGDVGQPGPGHEGDQAGEEQHPEVAGPALLLVVAEHPRSLDHVGLTPEDLNLDLGPLGPLLPRD
jgi:hypothetical protein